MHDKIKQQWAPSEVPLADYLANAKYNFTEYQHQLSDLIASDAVAARPRDRHLAATYLLVRNLQQQVTLLNNYMQKVGKDGDGTDIETNAWVGCAMEQTAAFIADTKLFIDGADAASNDPQDILLEDFMDRLKTRTRNILLQELLPILESKQEIIQPFKVRHLIMLSRTEFSTLPNLGRKGLIEIEDALTSIGLRFKVLNSR